MKHKHLQTGFFPASKLSWGRPQLFKVHFTIKDSATELSCETPQRQIPKHELSKTRKIDSIPV